MRVTKYVSIRFYEKSNYCKIIPINKPFSTECYYLGGMDKNPFMAIDCLNNAMAIKAAKHKMFKW